MAEVVGNFGAAQSCYGKSGVTPTRLRVKRSTQMSLFGTVAMVERIGLYRHRQFTMTITPHTGRAGLGKVISRTVVQVVTTCTGMEAHIAGRKRPHPHGRAHLEGGNRKQDFGR